MEEKEIDLLDLLKEILRHWKGIIVYMIIGAFAFTAFGLVAITKVGMDLTDTNQTAVLMVIDDER